MNAPRHIGHFAQVALLRLSRRSTSKKRNGLHLIAVPSADAATYVVRLSSRSISVERVPQEGESDFVGPIRPS